MPFGHPIDVLLTEGTSKEETQETSAVIIISKCRNAGIPGKRIVRHRHFYGLSTVSVRQRHFGIGVSPALPTYGRNPEVSNLIVFIFNDRSA